MTAIEIIEETAAAYTSKNRAIAPSGNCVYLAENGNKCAVGRCLNPSGLKFAMELREETGVGELAEYAADAGLSFDDLLEEKYKGHGEEFFAALQSFHDHDKFWSDSGLSYWGQLKKQELLELYGEKDEEEDNEGEKPIDDEF